MKPHAGLQNESPGDGCDSNLLYPGAPPFPLSGLQAWNGKSVMLARFKIGATGTLITTTRDEIEKPEGNMRAGMKNNM